MEPKGTASGELVPVLVSISGLAPQVEVPVCDPSDRETNGGLDGRGNSHTFDDRYTCGGVVDWGGRVGVGLGAKVLIKTG